MKLKRFANKMLVAVVMCGFAGVAYAQNLPGGTVSPMRCTSIQCIDSLQSLASYVLYLISSLVVPIIFTLAIIFFSWRLVRRFLMKGDAINSKEVRNEILNSLLILFVMFAIWGILAVLANTLNIQFGVSLPVPRFQ